MTTMGVEGLKRERGCLFSLFVSSGESAASNSNEGLSDAPLTHRYSFSQPTPPTPTPDKSVHLRVIDDPDFDTEVELPPLEAVIPKELLRKLKPKEKKRQEVINGSHRFCFVLILILCFCYMEIFALYILIYRISSINLDALIIRKCKFFEKSPLFFLLIISTRDSNNSIT